MSEDNTNGNGKKRQMNRLSRKQEYELVEQMKAHQPKFEARKSSNVEAARMLTKACGFLVTLGNVEGIRSDFDIQWKRKRGGFERGYGIGNDRARPIAQDLKRLSDQVQGINNVLNQLIDRLGERCLKDLLEDLDYSPISEKTNAIARSQGVPKQAPPKEDEDAEEGDC